MSKEPIKLSLILLSLATLCPAWKICLAPISAHNYGVGSLTVPQAETLSENNPTDLSYTLWMDGVLLFSQDSTTTQCRDSVTTPNVRIQVRNHKTPMESFVIKDPGDGFYILIRYSEFYNTWQVYPRVAKSKKG